MTYKQRLALILAVVFLFLMPILYLVIFKKKTNNNTNSLGITSNTNVSAPTREQYFQQIATYEKEVQKNPTYDNYIQLSYLYSVVNLHTYSAAASQKAINIAPDKGFKAYNNLGISLMMLGDYDAAKNNFNKALSIEPDFKLAKENIKWLENSYKAILKNIEENKDKKPDNTNLGTLIILTADYQKIGRHDEAIDLCNKIIQFDPKNTGALNNLGVSQMAKKEYSLAYATFQLASKLRPDVDLYKANLNWAKQELEHK
jgi:tetratricopeptide (TPR) repeat protein